MKTITLRSLVVAAVLAVAIVLGARADEFSLKGRDGKSWGPFKFQDGAPVQLDGGSYRVTAITNTPEQRLLRKLESIVIPEIDFRGASMGAVVEFLRQAAKKNDPAGEGVTMTFTASTGGYATSLPANVATSETALVTFSARSISLREALRIACFVSGFRADVRQSAVSILPKNAPAGPLLRRVYNVLPTIVYKIQALAPGECVAESSSWEGAKQFFTSFGVTWPEGSSVEYPLSVGKIVVVNTEENLAAFERVLAMLNVSPSQIRVEFFFVAFPTGMVAKGETGRPFTGDDALGLWKEGKGRAVVTLPIITQTGQEVTSKSVVEMIYPTDWSLDSYYGVSNQPSAGLISAVGPSGFESRDVGAVVTVLPEVSPDGQAISLTMTPQYIEPPEWEAYSMVIAVTGRAETTNAMCRQPLFATHSVQTSVCVKPGAVVVVGGGWPLRRTPEVMYLIIKADLVDLSGKVLPPVDIDVSGPVSL